MKKNTKRCFIAAGALTLLFIIYTTALFYVDVRAIGPRGSRVGFGGINETVHNALGVHMSLYNITDWLSIAAIAVMLGFAVLGLVQLIRRKKLGLVDSSILVLGGFYIVVFAAYLFFEFFKVNYRPVLINGILETSYPSSTTMLLLCVMPTAMMQFDRLIKSKSVKTCINIFLGVFTVFMVVGRAVSGVHWITDIIGGVILSAALVLLYCGVNAYIDEKKH